MCETNHGLVNENNKRDFIIITVATATTRLDGWKTRAEQSVRQNYSYPGVTYVWSIATVVSVVFRILGSQVTSTNGKQQIAFLFYV